MKRFLAAALSIFFILSAVTAPVNAGIEALGTNKSPEPIRLDNKTEAIVNSDGESEYEEAMRLLEELGIELVPHNTDNPPRSEVWDGSIAAGFAGGSGTQYDPYLISDGSQLAYLAQQVNNGTSYSGVYFEMTNDIYLNDISDYEMWGYVPNSDPTPEPAALTSKSSASTFDRVGSNLLQENIALNEQYDESAFRGAASDDTTPVAEGVIFGEYFEDDAAFAANWTLESFGDEGCGWFRGNAAEVSAIAASAYEGQGIAYSMSYQNYVGAFKADNWMTTAIAIPDSGARLSWYEKAQDSSYPDYYEVYVNDDLIYSGVGSSTWTNHICDLAAYAGQTIEISFRHNDYDEFLLLLDQIEVLGEVGGLVDAESIALSEAELTLIQGLEHSVSAIVFPVNATVIWESDNTDVATVDNGVIYGVAEGTATITAATVNGLEAICVVNVVCVEAEGITLSETKLTIAPGAEYAISATVLPDHASDKTVTWTSDNTDVATVDNGVIYGVAEGTATITAITANGLEATCTVTVETNPIDEALNAEGGSLSFTSIGGYPWIVENDYAKSSNQGVDSSSSVVSTNVYCAETMVLHFNYKVSSEANYDKLVVAADGTEVFRDSGNKGNEWIHESIVLAAGTHTMTWTYSKDGSVNNNEDTAWLDEVYLAKPVAVTGISLAETQVAIEVHDYYQLNYTITPGDATIRDVVWSSDNTAVATVDNTGRVYGVSEGTVNITVTTEDGNYFATCVVNVDYIDVEGISISPKDASVKIGSTIQFTATVYPENATNKNVVWSVDDKNVLSINQSGKATAVSVGMATVTVTTEDGEYIDSTVVRVEPINVTGITISLQNKTLSQGRTYRFAATITPSNATNKDVVWSVSDSSILSVDQTGNVTGLALGTAEVTVTTVDGGFVASAQVSVCYAPDNEWTPIGTKANSFSGIFNGGGFAVRGMYINAINDNQGLFGYVRFSNATISNLGVTDSFVLTQGDYCGGVAGRTYQPNNSYPVYINNCYNTGAVTGNTYVGGVCGYTDGKLTGCYNAGAVTGDNAVGGVCGYGRPSDCYNTGAITGNEYVGGVTGDGEPRNCHNTGAVTGNNYVGGVTGEGTDIINSYNVGVVTGNSSVGGVAGATTVSYSANTGYATPITNSYNTGRVIGNNNVGGVVGYIGGLLIVGCYNTGAVTGNVRVGGVIGYAANNYYVISTIGSYNIGTIVGNDNVGGIIGRSSRSSNLSVTDCYYAANSCIPTNSIGTPLTNEQMLSAENYAGFDFDTVWTMDGNPGYPYPKLIDNFQTAVPYTVVHHTGVKGGTYMPEKLEVFFGEPGTTVSAEPIEIIGYTFDSTVDGTCQSGVVAEDGSLILSLFYNTSGTTILPELNLNDKQIHIVETGTLYPIKGARIRITTADGYEAEVSSDFLGMASINLPDSSSYSLVVSCDGYISKTAENVQLESGVPYTIGLYDLEWDVGELGIGLKSVTYTDSSSAAKIDLLTHTKRLSKENSALEFTIVGTCYHDLIDGRYELLQDGDVIASSEDGVFRLKVADIKADIPIWMRVKHDGVYMRPIKLGLSVYKGAFSIYDGDKVELMDKLKLTIPDDVPFIGGSELELDTGYIPIKFSMDGDTFKLGLGTSNLFDPEDKELWRKLKLSTITKELDKSLEALIAADSWGGVSFGESKAKLYVFGFAEGKINANGPSIVEGQVVVKAEAKYEHNWQTFAWVIPIVVKVEGKVGLDNTFRISFVDGGPRFNDELELTLPGIKLSTGIGVAYAADVSLYGEVENKLGLNTATSYCYGQLDGEAGVSAKVLIWEGSWPVVSGSHRYFEGYYSGSKGITTYDILSNMGVDDFELISRDYLSSQSKWLGGTPHKDVASPKQVSVLQENIMPGASPQLVNVGGRTVAVWIADDGSRTMGNHAKLVYSVFDESNNTWSAPAAVWDDGTADFTPAIATDGTSAYVAWFDANSVFDETVTMEQMAAACEISYAKLTLDESDNLVVAEQTRLTENSSLDLQPSIAVHSGEIYVAWMCNTANDMLNQGGTNSILYRTVSGSETELIAIEAPISSLAIGVMNNSIHVAYSSDSDRDLATSNDAEVYIGTLQGDFMAITANEAMDRDVRFLSVNADENMLFFLSDGVLCSYDGNDVRSYESVTGLGSDYSIISNGNNLTYLLYTANNEDNAQIYVRIYDAVNANWKEPIALTSTPGYAEAFSAVIMGTKIVAMFTRTDVAISEDAVSTSTDLYAVVMSPSHDLTFNGVSFDELSVRPGEILPITLSVTNAGELDESGITITVSAEGVQEQTFEIDTSLSSGESKDVTIEYTMPSTVVAEKFTFNIASSSGEEIMLDDNTVLTTLLYPDFSIESEKLISDSAAAIIVTIANKGYIDAGAMLIIRRDSDTGEILAEYDIGNINAGKMKAIEFMDAYIKELMMGSENLYFEIIADKEEYNMADNSNFISITEIDLADALYKHTVSFVDWDGTVLSEQHVVHGAAADEPTIQERTGYVFIGWDTDFSFITNTITVTAQYAIARMVTFIEWDGTVIETQVVADGTAAIAPTVHEREGYVFIGWDVDFTNVTSDLTVTAQYEPKKYIVMFRDWDGTVISEQQIAYGNSAEAPDDPVREGFVFTGWSMDFRNITEACIIYATYGPIPNSGDIDADGRVTSTDAILVIRYALGSLSQQLTSEQIVVADVNNDGVLNSTDALLIMRKALGMVEMN